MELGLFCTNLLESILTLMWCHSKWIPWDLNQDKKISIEMGPRCQWAKIYRAAWLTYPTVNLCYIHLRYEFGPCWSISIFIFYSQEPVLITRTTRMAALWDTPPPPPAPWLPILVIHIRSYVKTTQSQSYKFKKNCQKFKFLNFARNFARDTLSEVAG